ncbi:MAG: GNAT family protein [Verrucomicrobiales bacterium]|nr:GNAT family protein [Verrucomicrobiales bacterium]
MVGAAIEADSFVEAALSRQVPARFDKALKVVTTQDKWIMELRKYIPKDFDTLKRWVPNERFMLRWAGPSLDYPLTVEQFESHLSNENIHGYSLAKDDTHVGYGEICKTSETSAMICRVIVSDNMRGKGYGKILSSRLVEVAFEEHSLKDLYLNVFDFNEAAIKCYQDIGFHEIEKIEGMREFEGEKWNIVKMKLSIQEEGWQGMKASVD